VPSTKIFKPSNDFARLAATHTIVHEKIQVLEEGKYQLCQWIVPGLC